MGLLAGLVVLAGEPHGRMVALAGKGHPTPASSRPASPESCIEDAAPGLLQRCGRQGTGAKPPN